MNRKPSTKNVTFISPEQKGTAKNGHIVLIHLNAFNMIKASTKIINVMSQRSF